MEESSLCTKGKDQMRVLKENPLFQKHEKYIITGSVQRRTPGYVVGQERPITWTDPDGHPSVVAASSNYPCLDKGLVPKHLPKISTQRWTRYILFDKD